MKVMLTICWYKRGSNSYTCCTCLIVALISKLFRRKNEIENDLNLTIYNTYNETLKENCIKSNFLFLFNINDIINIKYLLTIYP